MVRVLPRDGVVLRVETYDRGSLATALAAAGVVRLGKKGAHLGATVLPQPEPGLSGKIVNYARRERRWTFGYTALGLAWLAFVLAMIMREEPSALSFVVVLLLLGVPMLGSWAQRRHARRVRRERTQREPQR